MPRNPLTLETATVTIQTLVKDVAQSYVQNSKSATFKGSHTQPLKKCYCLSFWNSNNVSLRFGKSSRGHEIRKSRWKGAVHKLQGRYKEYSNILKWFETQLYVFVEGRSRFYIIPRLNKPTAHSFCTCMSKPTSEMSVPNVCKVQDADVIHEAQAHDYKALGLWNDSILLNYKSTQRQKEEMWL